MMHNSYPLIDLTEHFVAESNLIEGIHRAPLHAEVEASRHFLSLETITIPDLEAFVEVCQPGARLRDKVGLNVRVGSYLPPAGSKKIRTGLQSILDGMGNETPFETHIKYESLHPFTDGNGRSGRILWLWGMGGNSPLGFLHKFYYQTLDRVRVYAL